MSLHYLVSKMADSALVLSNPLCFLLGHFRNNKSVHQLKSAVIDFFEVEDLIAAKERLLEDVRRLVSPVNLPHIPSRREGEARAARIVDDIFTVLVHLDESLSLHALPRYVASGPDCMPSARMYEGDFAVLLNMVKKLSSEVIEMRSSLAAIVHDVRASQSRLPESFPALPQPAVVNNVNDQLRSLPQSHGAAGVISQSITKPGVGNSVGNVISDGDRSATTGPNWASLASTPVNRSNRYQLLASTTEDDDDGYEAVISRTQRRAQKRARNKTSPPVDQPRLAHQLSGSVQRGTGQQRRQQQQPQQQQQQRQRRSKLLVFGKAATYRDSHIYAAKSLVKKAVFYIGNVNKECSYSDIVSCVKGMNVNVLSCFEVRPRRRRVDDEGVDCKAFRLCINDDDTERMLDASLWPDSITVSRWYFMQPDTKANAGEKRRRVADDNIVHVVQQSVSQNQPRDSENVHVITVHDLDSGGVQNDTLSDDTILAINDCGSASVATVGNMDVESSSTDINGE